MKKFLVFILLSYAPNIIAEEYDVFGIGLFDVKFDGSSTNEAADFRYERRFDNILIDIGPESYNFFNLKPFMGVELTSDSASYFLAGIYLEENIGKLFTDESSNLIFIPSFGGGYYDDGDGKKLGHNIEFRTTFELAYQLENKNRIGFSFGHISNANIGEKNPGVEIISITYQIAH